MANITEWLNKIKSAIYGKDVRSAIYNSINSINNEVIANTSKQNSLEVKYNEQIKNMSLASPSMAEVVDARTSDTGVVYSTLGARLSAERVDGTLNLLKFTGLDTRDYLNAWNISSAVWNVSDDEDGITPHKTRSFRGDCDDTSTYYGVHQGIYLKSNTTYTMSMWILFDSSCSDDEGLVMQCGCKKSDGSMEWLHKYFKANALTKGQWNFVTYTFTTGSLLEDSKHDICAQTNKTKFHGYIGNLKLELGSHATDWSPNPNDIVYRSNMYTDEVKEELSKNYFIRLKPENDFFFLNEVYYPEMNTIIENVNFDFDTSTKKNKVPVSGVYRVDISLEIYYPGTDGMQSCEGDVDVLVNGISRSKHNYGIVMHNGRASCITCSWIGTLNKGDNIEVAVSNNDPQARTYDFRAANSWLSIYKI